MTLPTHLRLYVIKGVSDGRIYAVRHEARFAVEVKDQCRRAGLEVEIEQHVSRSGRHATGTIEFRCFPCPSHHLISVEAVDGRSEVYDGCCDAAAAVRDMLSQAAQRQLGLEMCDHSFEDLTIEHEEDQVEVGFNYASDSIQRRTVVTDIANQRCVKCDLKQVEMRACACVDQRS